MNTHIPHPNTPSIRLVGGGRDAEAVIPFFVDVVADAVAQRGGGGSSPRIHTLLVLEEDDSESIDRFSTLVTSAGGTAVVHAICEGERFDEAAVRGADALFVGGGLTPAYHDAFAEIAQLVRELVAAGTPYLGFSAGAAIAAEHALIGGHSIAGVPVCDEDAAEELTDVTVVAGLGLVPFSVDVHAAQWGTVSRLVAAVSANLTGTGVAIDEHTCLHWQGEDTASAGAVTGRGSAWQVTSDSGRSNSAVVRRLTAAS